MSLRDLTQNSVMQAIAQFDQIGQQEFLREKYGFGRARRFYLVQAGRFYDSKAIAGAAHGFATDAPLKAEAFSGGEAAAAGKLRALGFTVLDLAAVPDSQVGSADPLGICRKRGHR